MQRKPYPYPRHSNKKNDCNCTISLLAGILRQCSEERSELYPLFVWQPHECWHVMPLSMVCLNKSLVAQQMELCHSLVTETTPLRKNFFFHLNKCSAITSSLLISRKETIFFHRESNPRPSWQNGVATEPRRQNIQRWNWIINPRVGNQIKPEK